MLHFTCDGCGKKLRNGSDHHVVKLEVYAAGDPIALTEADLEDDHMEAVSEILQDMEELDEVAEIESSSQYRRYDLCPSCCKRFLRDPLGRDAAQKFDFSEN